MKKVRHYNHFIFDFDGVISNSFDLAVQNFNEIRDELFPSLPRIKTKEDMTIVYGGSLKTCLNRWIGQEGTKVFFDNHSQRMQKVYENIEPFPNVINALNSLGEKKISIVTSSYSSAVKNILTKDPCFKENVIYKIAGRELHQTKTKKIKTILNELGLTNKEAVYIGDLESDILYCRDVPIDIISVGYGYHPGDYLQKLMPTYFSNSVSDLDNLLKQMTYKP